jgi:FkbM family methyltransferase
MIVKVKNCKFDVRSEQDHIQKHWKVGNFYEASKNGLLAYMFRNKYTGRCIDIGASIGNHTVYFSKVLGCKVTSIEPSPDSFKHLQYNVSLNDCDANLINCALGEKEGKCRMESISDKNVGMKQVREDEGGIPIMRLDDLVEGQFDFIKIDVEHYNTPLLKGAKETLMNQKKCHVFIECETQPILAETSKIMRSYGYERVAGVKLNHTPTFLFVLS